MDQKDEIKSKVDIVEIISSYLPLKKAGRNFAALCPFHGEKTPSFMISPERQVFKCFGCNEGGDVFTFLEKIEGWDFREALEELAKRVGVKLTKFAPSSSSKLKEKLLEISKLAAKFYSHLLEKHPAGEKARQYLSRREIKKPIWEKFSLGYAPAGWENTLGFLTKRGFSLSDVAASGLVVARLRQGFSGQARENTTGVFPDKEGYYDRFRDRLIFPLKDSRGTVLGFAGRTIEQETRLRQGFGGQARDEPKYINSPDTPIFNKGSLLFGMDVAREDIRQKNEAVLVEGEFDVLSAHQAGCGNVVASKGTALTDKQVAQLGRLCETVSLCFDTDLAGDTAARRGIELLDLAGVNVKVIGLGKYKDPDEFVKADAAGFKNAIGSAMNIYDYFIESASKRYDPKTATGKKKIGQEVLPVLAKISDDVMRAHYITQISRILDLDVNLIAQAVEKKVKDIPLTGPGDAEGDSQKQKLSCEEYFLALLISQDQIEKGPLGLISSSDFESGQAREFWKWLGDIIKSSKPKSFKKLLRFLPKDLNSFVDNLYLVNISPTFGDKELWAEELVKIAKRIRQISFRRKLSAISEELKDAQEKSDNRRIKILTKRFDQTSKYLKEGLSYE